MKNFMLMSVLSMLYWCSHISVAEERLYGIEKDIQFLLDRYDAPGLSVAVVHNKQLIYVQGFGQRDITNNKPVNADTIFHIGSVTKSFTSALIGQLVDKKALSLSAKPSLYLPDFQFQSLLMQQRVTIKDLLSHRSGLGNADAALTLFPAKSSQSLIEQIKHLIPETAPADSWQYSNMGYSLLSVIAEQASGQTWGQAVELNLFKPLNMERSYISQIDSETAGNYPRGYGRIDNQNHFIPFEPYTANAPAGAIKSSAKDMANWMLGWLNSGRYGANQVIPEKYVESATQLQNIMPQDSADSQVYLFGDGLGWRVQSHKGHYKIQHGGNVSGFSTQLVMFPNEKLGILAMTNQNTSILPHLVVDAITNRMLALEPVPIDAYPVVVNEVYKVPNTHTSISAEVTSSLNLSEVVGEYHADGFGKLAIAEENNKLFIDFPAYRLGLKHLEGRRFETFAIEEFPRFMVPTFQVLLDVDEGAQSPSLTIRLRAEPVVFTKVI